MTLLDKTLELLSNFSSLVHLADGRVIDFSKICVSFTC